GLPLAPAIAATCIADFVNRAYLYRTAGAVAAGEFSVALRFGSVAALMVAGFQLAWQPRAYALGRGDAALRHIALDGQRILAVVVTGVVGLALVSPEVVGLLTGGRFPAVLPAVGAMLVAALAMGLYVVACLPSAMDSAMRDLGIAAICGVAVTFLSNLVLAPALGSAGTALSVVVGQFTAVATVRLLANGRRVRVGFPWWRMTLLVAGAAWRIRLVENPGRSTAAGLNEGINQTRGSIVGAISGHSVPSSEYVERAVEALERTGAWAVGGIIERAGRNPVQRAIARATA